MKEKELEGGYKKALRYLSYKSRTVFEVQRYLERKGYNKDAIKNVIDKLCHMEYLDDYKFALDYLDYQIKNGNKGPKILENKLRQKGVPGELITNAMENVIDEEVELDLAKKILKKKYGDISGKSYEEKQKTGAFLSRKGFSYEVIIKSLNLETGPF